MGEKNEQHNPSSYAELILFSANSTENEFAQHTNGPKRLIPGMFSSISDAELITQRLTADYVEDEDETI